MKKKFSTRKIIDMVLPVFISTIALTPGSVNGQTWCAAANTEYSLSCPVPMTKLSCANITYNNGTHSGQLGVIASGFHSGFVVFDDLGHSVSIGYPCTGDYIFDDITDVVIGNGVTQASPHVADYRVALIYTPGGTGNVYLDEYDITGYGTSGLAATYISTSTINTGSFTHPRMDLIEETSILDTYNPWDVFHRMPTPGGLPNCTRLAITYADASGPGRKVYAMLTDLMTPLSVLASTVYTPAPTSNDPSVTDFYEPDIAGWQLPSNLVLGGTNITPCASGAAHDVVYVNFVDNGRFLWGAEWYPPSPNAYGCTVGPSSLGSPIPPPSATSYYYEPRVDAYDDYSAYPNPYNHYILAANCGDQSYPGVPFYNVHAFVSFCPGSTLFTSPLGTTPIPLEAPTGSTYSWTSSGGSGINIPSGSSPTNFVSAAVAAGANSQYWVSCFTDANGGHGPHNYVAGTVDENSGGVPFPALPYCLNTSTIYQVNSTSGTVASPISSLPSNSPSYIEPTAPLAMSSCVNNQSISLVAYAYGWLSTLHYKWVTSTVCGAAYKPETSNVNSLNADKININPNPASDVLQVSGVETGNYAITDIEGRVQMKGAINSNKQTINISNLPNAIYFILLTDKDNNIVNRTKFVKD